MQIITITIVATRPGQHVAKSVKVAAADAKATCQQLRAEGWMISSTFASFK